MKARWEKKELVAMCMESPLYFELLVRERLVLLQDLTRRIPHQVASTGRPKSVSSGSEDQPACGANRLRTGGADSHHSSRLIVGYLPPKRPVRT